MITLSSTARNNHPITNQRKITMEYTLENTARATHINWVDEKPSFIDLSDKLAPCATGIKTGEWIGLQNHWQNAGEFIDLVMSENPLELSRPHNETREYFDSLFNDAPEWATGYARLSSKLCAGLYEHLSDSHYWLGAHLSDGRYWLGDGIFLFIDDDKDVKDEILAFGHDDDEGIAHTKDKFTIIATRPPVRKTIIDAVKHYRGDKFVCGKHEMHHTHIVNANGTDRFYSAYASDIVSDTVICTISEHNQFVHECSINAAAPPIDDKPVYTQDMQGAGEFPPVGSLILVADHNNYEMYNSVEVKYISKDLCVINDRGEDVSFDVTVCKILAIDQRTEEEKEIDKACAIIEDSQRCTDFNVNIDASAAMKAVIVTMIKNGYRKAVK